MTKSKFIIGIDPDVEKSGVAIQKDGNIEVKTLSFFEIYDYLKFYQFRIEKPIVYIECGYLNKSNWHVNSTTNNRVSGQIGQRTGANHEVAKKLCEMCEYLGLEHIKIKPTSRKLDAKTFKQITGITSILNQDQRDSVMLIYGR